MTDGTTAVPLALTSRSLWLLLLLVPAPARAQSSTAQSLTYPATRRDSVVDEYYGTRIADPYRWLEQLDSPATTGWVTAQGRLTDGYLESLPQRELIARRLAALWNCS